MNIRRNLLTTPTLIEMSATDNTIRAAPIWSSSGASILEIFASQKAEKSSPDVAFDPEIRADLSFLTNTDIVIAWSS